MQKIKFFCFIAALIFITSTQALTAKEESQTKVGPADPAETEAALLGALEDERVTDLKNQYRSEIEEVSIQIRSESDPLKREQLQREIHRIKEEQEIETLELRLDIAEEKGNTKKAEQLQKTLDQAYMKMNTVQTGGSMEVQKQPQTNSKKSNSRKKSPDEM